MLKDLSYVGATVFIFTQNKFDFWRPLNLKAWPSGHTPMQHIYRYMSWFPSEGFYIRNKKRNIQDKQDKDLHFQALHYGIVVLEFH